MIKTAIIRKLPSGEYRLYSRKRGPDGKRRNLGTYKSRAGAEQRDKDVQMFKHMEDDADDKPTKMLKDLSGIAKYLEEAGFIDKADKIYAVMSLIDGSLEQNLVDHNLIPDDQRNIENQGYQGGESPIGGGYSMLGIDEAQRADDQDNVDAAVRSNGLQGNTAIDNGNFSGFSDAYFYRGVGSVEENM